MKKLLTMLLALVLMTALLAGCKKQDAGINNETLITVDDVSVPIKEALFYMVSMQKYYESQLGPDAMTQEVNGGTLGDELKAQALQYTQNSNLMAIVAKDKGIALTEEEKKTQDDNAKTYFESMDPAVVAKYGFTLELAQSVFEKSSLEGKVTDTMTVTEDQINAQLQTLATQDRELAAILELGTEASAVKVRAKHILIETIDETTGSPLSDEEIAAAKAKAEEVLAKAKADEDFVELVKAYSQDAGSLETDGEYTFARGVMVEPFETAAFSMNPGDISGLVETTYGYHIIKLEEKDIQPTDEEVQERVDYLAQQKTSAESYAKQAAAQEAQTQWKLDHKVTVDEALWANVKVEALPVTEVTTDETTSGTTSETTSDTTSQNAQ